MKTSAEKSSTTTSSTATHAANRPFFPKTGEGGFFMPQRSTVAPVVQMKMTVNKPGDKLEQEADTMAGKVMRMPSPAPTEKKTLGQTDEKLQKKEKEKEEKIQRAAIPGEKAPKKEEEKIQKAAASEEKLQREGSGAPSLTSDTQSSIQGKTTGGQPLSSDVRGFMEPRFNADFSNVRIHTDAESAGLSNQLSARAFTYQNHVFFSRDQYQPGSSEGKQLLAHELTHTIQQGHAVQRSPQVTTTVTPPMVQRLGIRDVLDYFADKANVIPGFRMLTLLLGFNPINMRSTARNAANLLRALIELIPGGAFITQALDNHGVINKAADWVEQRLAAFGDIGSEIVNSLKRFVDSLSWSDIFDLGGVWERARSIFTAPIARLIAFGGSVVSEILKMVKDAILKPLAALAQGTRGYDLLKAILGEDPITGEPVPRNADTLIGGFMKLIGQEEVWENIKKGNAVARAWAWFQGALAGLMGFVRAIPGKIVATLRSLTFQDIITVAGAFGKIVSAFANIAGEFISWGLNQVISLLEILFSVVAPSIMPYIRKAQASFITILKNPIGFVGNLVRAGKMGFEMFAGNIIEHLKAALIKWLVGPLADAGVYIPKSFDLIEIVKLVLSVLGLTWQNIRSKLVKIIPEPVLVGLEKTAGILVTLVKDGPAAAWEQIKAELSELKDQLIAQITQMISIEVVKAAVMKLVSMLNPAGAVVQAIIAIYKTITFFIEKIQQIAAVVASFIDSVSAIAAGQVANAAKKVEQTMARTLTIVITFLAKFAGLGGIPDKIVGIVKKIRQPIDKGLDKIVAWLGNMLKKLVGAAKAGISKVLQWWRKKVPIIGGGESHTLQFEGGQDDPKLMVRSKPITPAEFILDFTPSNEVKSKVDSITNEINAIKQTLAAAQKKSPPDEAAITVADKKLTERFNELGKVLAESLDRSEDEGSKNGPLPIDYPKRRAAAYPNIYTGPLTQYYLDQKWLKNAATKATESDAKKELTKHELKLKSEPGFISWNGKVTVYRAARGPNQTIFGGQVGLDPAFADLTPGKVLVYADKAGTGGGSKINNMFRPYGFRAGTERMDGDHIVERQLGGPDIISNLWPLERSENRSSGATVKSMKVKFKNKDMTVHEARQKKPNKTLHLLIKSVK
ncbi:MAG: DUF4157 domain-containing protein [Candidatus Brocadia sp.]|nr:DUF4157 domain-containing protein [Candidatus Brocadia sp.]